MSEPRNAWAQERALWQRWSAMGERGDEPDALTLAAFAEDRLSDAARAAVEVFLAVDPAIAEDIAAARESVWMVRRDGDEAPDDGALAATIARAAALVAVPAGVAVGGGNVLPLRRRRQAVSPWPNAARWGALAASLALVSWLGFALGSDAYGNLAALDGQSGPRLVDELLDPPTGFFGLVDSSET
jgi:hypothetical protein